MHFATFTQELFANDIERNGEVRVLGVDPPGIQVDEFFGVAVVGGNKHSQIFVGHDSHINFFYPTVDQFTGFDGGLVNSGVGNHVGIGVVDDNEII